MRELGTHTVHLSTIAVAASGQRGCDVVHLTGQLDMNTAPWVRDRLLADDSLTRPRLLLELDGLDLLDSSGIGAIVLLHRRSGERETELELVTASTHLRKLLRISGLDTVIAIHETLAQARTQGSDPDAVEPLSAG